jgi:hypothetical protein
MVERDLSRQVDWMSRADCMASSVTGSNSDDLFRQELLKVHVYPVSLRTIEDFVA